MTSQPGERAGGSTGRRGRPDADNEKNNDRVGGAERGVVEVFFSDDYVAAATTFDTTRKSGLLAANLAADPVAGVVMRAPEPVGRTDIERIHAPAYVDAVLTGDPDQLAESSGLGWDPGHVTALLASTGGCVAAARSAWRNGVAGSLSSGLHHARTDHGAGYCTFNGIVLSVLTLLGLGAKGVLVLDLDAHCGGGTNEIMRSDRFSEQLGRFTQLDVSTNEFDGYWPLGDSTLDLIDDPDDYLTTITGRLHDLPDHIDAVIYNSGMDPHQDCGIGGLRGVDDRMITRRERLVFDWAAGLGVPIMFVLAGGYSGSKMSAEHLTALHRLTVQAAADGAARLPPPRKS